MPKPLSDKEVASFAGLAAAAKKEISGQKCVTKNPNSSWQNPYHNPIAATYRPNEKEKESFFSAQTENLITELKKSAKLIITDENMDILKNYYNARKDINDPLGKLYKKLSFEDFILRLFHKRYKEVYLDGRALVLRDNTSPNDESRNCSYLKNPNIDEYLTLEEMILSPLVLPQVTSLVIGTGNRNPENKWDVKKEFDESCDIATFSYPAAAEFRDGNTLHYDLLFLTIPKNKYNQYTADELKQIGENSAIQAAAKSIYGHDMKEMPTFADIKQDSQEHILINGNQPYFLIKAAYINRTKNMLKSLLTAADAEMQEKGLGETFQLKGLGLGAFAFSGKDSTVKLEKLYIEAVEETLNEIDLKYINHINLINLPSTFSNQNTQKYHYKKFNRIALSKTNMDATVKQANGEEMNVGGTVFCGDSGSMVGNEGNIGLTRNSSDDPATQYSLLDPNILNPVENKHLLTKECISILQVNYQPKSPVVASSDKETSRNLPDNKHSEKTKEQDITPFAKTDLADNNIADLHKVCSDYKEHLEETKEQDRTLLTKQKIDIMGQLLKSLESGSNVEKIDKFKAIFINNYNPTIDQPTTKKPKPLTCRDILAKRRDSGIIIVFKVIATFFSLGIAYALGMWDIKGKNVRNELADKTDKLDKKTTVSPKQKK
jgi:hypothetical protein